GVCSLQLLPCFRYIAEARAVNPADMWTTVPPAKSRTPILNRIPSGCHVACANGAYIKIKNKQIKRMYEVNRMRSANAPVINAGVMIANFSWYMANSAKGIVGAPPQGSWSKTSLNIKKVVGFPTIP